MFYLKNNWFSWLVAVGSLILLTQCQKPVATSRTGSNDYSEDLSSYRPEHKPASFVQEGDSLDGDGEMALVEPSHQINHTLDSILDSISQLRLV